MKIIIRTIVVLALTAHAFCQTWVQTSAPNASWQSVALSADGTKAVAVIGVHFGEIFTSTDSGSTWIFQTNAPHDFNAFWFSVASSADGTKLIAAENGGLIFISADSGITWISSSATSNDWLSVSSSADGTKVAAVASPSSYGGDGIYASTNSGLTWTLQTNAPANNYWTSVASSSDGNKLVAVSELDVNGDLLKLGKIYVSLDSGITWVQTSAPTNNWIYAASSADGSKLAAVSQPSGFFPGNGGNIYTSTDYGTTWISNNVPIESWKSVASSADGIRLLSVTSDGKIYTSFNSGNDWFLSTNLDNQFTSSASSADGYSWLTAGFNAVWASKVIPVPTLNIAYSDTNLVVSWIVPSTSFVLQQNFNLTSTNWTTVTNIPTLNLTNLQNQVIISPTTDTAFYRLQSQ